jgi:hypothetical protein
MKKNQTHKVSLLFKRLNLIRRSRRNKDGIIQIHRLALIVSKKNVSVFICTGKSLKKLNLTESILRIQILSDGCL